MLSEVKERLEGPKCNIDFGGKGKGIGMSTMQKRAIFGNCLNTIVPHYIVGSLACIHTAKAKQWASVCLKLV